VKITLAQQNYIIGDFEHNTQKIITAIHRAISEDSQLVVFPELSVCGYPPRDFLEFKDFITRCEASIKQIAAHSKNIGVIVGAPSVNPDVLGKDLFNSAYYLYEGEVKQVVHKTLLPTYDVFDEVRYFESAKEQKIIVHRGTRIAITICEDIWNTGDNPLYTTTPLDILVQQSPELIINISASPFDFNQNHKRHQLIAGICNKYHLPLFYCNTTGAQTELIFDGGSMVCNQQGLFTHQLPFFEESISTIDTEALHEIKQFDNPKKIELIHDALVYGIKEYFGKMNFKKAILGLSGGVDSALVMTLATRALGSENILAVLMPSEYSSEHSIKDSLHLCKNLDITHHIIPITETFHSALQTLQPYFSQTTFNLTEENMQARIRAVYLMALSNKNGYILLNTSNKSEAAVGYGTLYGDMCGGLSVIGDLYKTQVYELCTYINRNKEIIPTNILTKEPSAELRPNQKDSDSLPEYDILDKVLHHYIEERKGPDEIKSIGYEPVLVDRILRMVNMNEYKRHQTPPILRVSSKSFGSGRRMPIVGKYLD
jgi:NAD+ synthase (glutamine-hydrolysing)